MKEKELQMVNIEGMKETGKYSSNTTVINATGKIQ
jgi:hypothetical protein